MTGIIKDSVEIITQDINTFYLRLRKVNGQPILIMGNPGILQITGIHRISEIRSTHQSQSPGISNM